MPVSEANVPTRKIEKHRVSLPISAQIRECPSYLARQLSFRQYRKKPKLVKLYSPIEEASGFIHVPDKK